MPLLTHAWLYTIVASIVRERHAVYIPPKAGFVYFVQAVLSMEIVIKIASTPWNGAID